MKQSLQLKFSQNLALTPQLQQSIRLLQLSSQELNQELEVVLQENPLLERMDKNDDGSENGSAFSSEGFSTQSAENSAQKDHEPASEHPQQDSLSEDYFGWTSNHRWEENNSPDDDSDFVFQEAVSPSLREHLISQLKLMPLSARDQTLSIVLVDAINEDGYLEQALDDLAALLPTELEIEILELQTALKHIQHLDPPGVGARNLSECLMLQLQLLPKAIREEKALFLTYLCNWRSIIYKHLRPAIMPSLKRCCVAMMNIFALLSKCLNNLTRVLVVTLLSWRQVITFSMKLL